MAKAVTVKKVKATVVRGSYWDIDDDGNREHIVPDMPEGGSDVIVTEAQLLTFNGVMVRSTLLEAELEKVRSEKMQGVTPTNVATEPAKGKSIVGSVIDKLSGGTSDAGNAS
jgi:hypothetical protein